MSWWIFISLMDHKSLLPAQKEGEGKEKKLAQNSAVEPKRDLQCQTSKARVMKRGQRPQVSKSQIKRMERGVCSDKDVLWKEQLKDPACVDALCWITQRSRPGQDEILSSRLDHKFLWSNYECLVVQDGLLYNCVGPLADGLSLVTVYVPASLRKEVIHQCGDTSLLRGMGSNPTASTNITFWAT